MLPKFFCAILFLLLFNSANAQLEVISTNNPSELAQKMVGKGIKILSATYTGVNSGAGIFKDYAKGFGMDSGIILTTGRATDAVGKSSQFANFAATSPGNPILTTYSGQILTKNACILDFDFIPSGDSISVSFVFASEEYPEFVCKDFNDVFAFFISGPGISGLQNIALIPGTSIPVSINSINTNINNPGCTSLGPGAPFASLYEGNSDSENPTTSKYLRYDGYTKVITVKAKVQSCQVYHAMIGIADALDDSFDSGVFVEAGSFISDEVTLSNEGGFTDSSNNRLVVEGCTATKIKLTMKRSFSSAVTVGLKYSGSAINGVDYKALPSTITFAAGETEKWLDVIPVADNVKEPTEDIIIGVQNLACASPLTIDSTIIYLKDSIAFIAKKDTFVCSALPILLTTRKVDTASSNTWLWSNNVTTQQSIISSPGVYWAINTFNNNCYNIDTFYVANRDPIINNVVSQVICGDVPLQLLPSVLPVGGTYLWDNGSTYPYINVTQPGTYTLQYTTSNGCFTTRSFTTEKRLRPYTFLGKDTALCAYEQMTLNAYYPNASYVWNTGATTSSITVKGAGEYIVKNTLNGCSASDTIYIASKLTPVADIGKDLEIFKGGQAQLNALHIPANHAYAWSPASYLSNSNVNNPVAFPPVTTSFFLTVTSVDDCIDKDTVEIVVKPYHLDVPNTFSPNGDGINDVWNIPLLGSYLNASIQVFNRGGQVVFNSTGYATAWNGTHNGKPLPAGVYYYIIEPGKGRPRQTGTLTIIR